MKEEKMIKEGSMGKVKKSFLMDLYMKEILNMVK
jgi:hypothetical protein